MKYYIKIEVRREGLNKAEIVYIVVDAADLLLVRKKLMEKSTGYMEIVEKLPWGEKSISFGEFQERYL